MKKLIFLLTILLFSCLKLFSQRESIDNYCSTNKLEEFIKKHPGISDAMFATKNKVNESEALLVGWGSFTEVFGLSFMPVGFLGDVFEPAALKKSNTAIGHIGEGIALIQLSIDMYNGNYNQGTITFSKSAMFWAIGKFGWKSLKVASYGMQIIDYSLNEFGKAAKKTRTDSWRQAYNDYYKDSGGGKHSIEQWKEKFKDATTKEKIEKIIDAHVQEFWDDDFRDTYKATRTMLGYV